MGKGTARDLKIEWLPISALKPDPRNPKQHSARQIKQIAQSIKTFGNLVPVLIDRENKISGRAWPGPCRAAAWADRGPGNPDRASYAGRSAGLQRRGQSAD
jgi:hypothetical protein